ncbi:anti-sigma-D factor RsdA [Mycolicibacterium vinylchloridicum]|uniref:anti-sigma-D factor RsdA n=1 Tax=Mycolicibacterium vinylchloridicum TaxID=2736928 RepID=UPI0015CDE782|nr:anti-sigma-D factor RsdA [Mycolicibacterium vinylchloridicum]
MPDFGRNSRGDDPSLDAIVSSDRFIDALAAGQQVTPQDQGDAMLAELLGGWRDEMRWPPATGLITERDAVAALRTGLAEKQSSGRSRRGLSIVGAAAAGVLALGGFGAVVAGAGPGDALYGLRTWLFGEPKQVRDDQVTLANATEQLKQVQQLVEQGDWAAAQAKLVEVNNQVAAVADAPQKQQVLEQWNELSAKVVQQDPEATVPPGITYTVPPSATELVPAVITPTDGPEVPPTSVPSLPPITISTTPDSTGTFGPSPSDTPTTPSDTPTTTVDPTTTTVAPTTTTTTTVAPTSTTTTTVAPTTTTTTVAPTTTTTTTTLPAATTTTSASAAAQAPAAATTTAAAAESPAAASTSTVVQQSSAPTTASIPTATQQPIISIPSTVIQAPKTQPPAAVITTTMVMPMPQLPKLPSSGGSHSSGSSDGN